MQAQVGELDGRVKQVGALGAALAGPHSNPRSKGDNAVAGAVGVYRGQTALAAGYFRHLNDQVMVSLGGSTTGNEWSTNAGFTVSW